MRLVAISMSLLMILVTVSVATSQETKSKKKKSPQSRAKNVAGTQDTDPGDTPGLSVEELDNAAVGSIYPDDNPAGDPAETGKRMVMQGMSIQLSVLAAQIRATEDADVRKSKMAELRETVGVVVGLRQKYLKERIARLEKLAATLRKEAEKKDAVDEMVKQLLTSPAPSTEPGDDPADPAEGRAGGTDTDDAGLTEPGDDRDDPAEKKDKQKDKDKDKDKKKDKDT